MSDIKELTLIRLIERIFAMENRKVLTGIGDDCAIFRARKGYDIFVTTDTLTEETHFKRDWTTPELLGGKLAEVNLSDIAAMGASSKYLLLSISLDGLIDYKWIKNLLDGFKKSIAGHGSILIGGNISSARELSFTVTAIGEAPCGEKVTRNGARPGDHIFVTGTPGDSALGLDLLMSNKKTFTRAEKKLITRHNSPTARVKWGRLLASKKLVSAMIDISDGVALDLARLLEASGHGAKVDLSLFPLSKEARAIVSHIGAKGWKKILSGGEDYELLFTARPGKAKAVEAMIKSGKITASCIGRIVKKKSGTARLEIMAPSGARLKLEKEGWLHGAFRQK